LNSGTIKRVGSDEPNIIMPNYRELLPTSQ